MSIRQEFVRQQFVVNGKTDNFIASALGVTRSTVTHFRKYHGICRSELAIGELGERKTKEKLESLGFAVRDMNKEENKIHPYDLLVDAKIRLDVKTANCMSNNVWYFSLSNKPENGNRESERFIKLKNGRMKKILSNSCDFLILCALKDGKQKYHIIPSNKIPKDCPSICLTTKGKYSVWENRWDLLSQQRVVGGVRN